MNEERMEASVATLISNGHADLHSFIYIYLVLPAEYV